MCLLFSCCEVAGRKFLRAKICAKLVLCDMNESRSEVLAEVEKFNEKKSDLAYVAEIEERRKAAAAEKKKKKSETAPAVDTAPKAKRTTKATQKYTPSKF